MATKSQKKRSEERKSASRRFADKNQGGDRTTIIVPDGIKMWKPSAGKSIIDILPFKAGSTNPNADKGELYFERTYWAHRGIGPNNESHVCVAKSFGKKCVICEHTKKLNDDPTTDEELLKKLRPQKRILLAIIDRKEPEEVQLVDMSFFAMGDALVEAIEDADDDDSGDEWFNTGKSGLSLKLLIKEESGGSFKFLKVNRISFVPRKKAIDKGLAKSAPCLDELLKELEQKKLKELLLMTADDDDDDDDDEPKKGKGKKGGKKKSKEDDEDDDDDESDDDSDDEDEDSEDEDDSDDDDNDDGDSEDSDDDSDDDDSEEDDDDDDDESDDEDEDEEEDEEEDSKKGKGKSRTGSRAGAGGKGKGKKSAGDDADKDDDDDDDSWSDDDDDDDDDDDESDDDDSDDDEPAGKKSGGKKKVTKKPAKKAAPKKKAAKKGGKKKGK